MEKLIKNKHAYLIIAHNEFELLKVLLSMLDYENNDIYLHVDIKAGNIEQNEFLNCVKKSKIYFIEPRMDVQWGNFSQIECEYKLLETATRENSYLYYHILSGVDLPLKPQKEIHDFFDKNRGTEFIQYENQELTVEEKCRVSKYHFFAKKKKNIYEKILDKLLLLMQKKVDRTEHSCLIYKKGANWCSITDDFARYVIDSKDLIQRSFKYTICGDEMFLQSLAYSSKFREHISSNNYCDNYETIGYVIDWKRGNPYIFRSDDFEQLISSNQLFARKFSWDVDKNIILKIKEYVIKQTSVD